MRRIVSGHGAKGTGLLVGAAVAGAAAFLVHACRMRTDDFFAYLGWTVIWGALIAVAVVLALWGLFSLLRAVLER